MFLVFLGQTANAADQLVFVTSKSGWLVWIAEERGLFESNGANVKVELVGSGVAAGDGLADGRFDIANMSEFAFTTRNFARDDLRAIGTVAALYNMRLVANKQSGITSLDSLSGKSIGLTRTAISEFFLGKLLDTRAIDPGTVTVVDIRAPALPGAVAGGEVDAIISWEPYARQASDSVGGDAYHEKIQDTNRPPPPGLPARARRP